MSRLHYLFLKESGPTDVLTFELDHDEAGRVVVGEVAICAAVARRHAGPSHDALKRELLLYALHGMLHLCGFDDRTDLGYAAMHAKEDEILVRLGIGPVFASRVAPRRRNPRSSARRPSRRGPPGVE